MRSAIKLILLFTASIILLMHWNGPAFAKIQIAPNQEQSQESKSTSSAVRHVLAMQKAMLSAAEPADLMLKELLPRLLKVEQGAPVTPSLINNIQATEERHRDSALLMRNYAIPIRVPSQVAEQCKIFKMNSALAYEARAAGLAELLRFLNTGSASAKQNFSIKMDLANRNLLDAKAALIMALSKAQAATTPDV